MRIEINDNAFFALALMVALASTLVFCGDPDLHDALIERVAQQDQHDDQ